MNYQIKINAKALKSINKQPKEQQKRILKAIYNLPNGDTKPLKGNFEYSRLRVGDYRIIYTVNHDEVIIYVVKIGNRGDIYKSL